MLWLLGGDKMRIFVVLLALVAFGVANPAPLGFTLDKTTYDDIAAKFRSHSPIKNLDTGGTSLYVDRTNFSIDGLVGNSVRFGFDNQDKLVSVVLSFRKAKFKELFSSLSKQYTLLSQTSKGGESFVKFESDDSIISLDRLKKRTLLTYTSKKELKRQKQQQREEMRRKKRSRDNLKKML